MMRAILILSSFAALALFAGVARAEPFTFQTNWVAQAEHGGYYQALADGTYAACGLDVAIRPGGPQVNGRALLLAGKVDAYMGGNMLSPFNGLVEGIPFKVVAAHFQKEPQVFMTHPGRAKRFEDLADLTIYVGDEGYLSFYQWMISEYGFTEEKRRVYTYNSGPFIQDANAAQQGYVTSEPFAIQKEAGFAPDNWLLADQGFDSYSTTVEVMQATIDDRPEQVQCFVDGSAIGWTNFLYGDNEAAIALIMKDNPDLGRAQIDYAVQTMKQYGIVDSGDSLELGIGAMTDARQRSFYDKMVRSGVLPADLPIKDAYTLQFVNKGVGLDVKAELSDQ